MYLKFFFVMVVQIGTGGNQCPLVLFVLMVQISTAVDFQRRYKFVLCFIMVQNLKLSAPGNLLCDRWF